MDTVGFIGLGNMGSGISKNIQNAGYPMVVYDLQEGATRPLLEGGARLASSPAEVASLSDLIFSSLPGPREVETTAIGSQGVLEGVKEGGVYVDLSSSSPSLIRRIEPLFRQKGAHLLDAPVTGGKIGAATGKLNIVVGGDQEIYKRIKPLLETFGEKVLYAGGIGNGHVCKLAHNMVGGGVRQAIAEALTLAVKAGLDPQVLLEFGSRGNLGRAAAGLAQTVFLGQFDDPTFTLALNRKDLGLATDLGREVNVPMPVANLAEQMAIQAMNRGWGDKDPSILFLLQEEMAGVEVRIPEEDQ